MTQSETSREGNGDFSSLWPGGYYEGDPLDPMGASGYGPLGFMSVLHATYLACIKPYVSSETVAIEIGPGRGAWTRCLLAAREVWCLDALSAEHNAFWEYIGPSSKVRYLQVTDFGCTAVPDRRFDFLFTFGTFCHIPFSGITKYMESLRTKLKPGANCFLMVADFAKYNRALARRRELDAGRTLGPGLRGKVLRPLLKRHAMIEKNERNDGETPDAGLWYNAGVERTCEMLSNFGYRVVDPDMGVNHRDPMIHCVWDS